MPGSLWWLTLAALICLAVATASTTGEETDREPVVLIPGLLGSVLNYADVVSRQPLGLAWLRFFDDDDVVRKFMLVRYNQSTALTETLNPAVFLSVEGGNHGLDGISLLDPYDWLGITAYFRSMIDALLQRGYTPGSSLFGMPYNWIDHNVLHVDVLVALIERAFNSSGGHKVHLVAHSMGNMVTKLYLALHPDHACRYVASWTALAPPFLGAGGAGIESILQGRAQLPTFLLAKKLDHALQVVAPTSYELLPADDHKWGTLGAPSLAYRNATTGQWTNVTMGAGFVATATASLVDNSIEDPHSGGRVLLPFGSAQLAVAERTVRRLVQAPLAQAFPFPYAGVIGTAVDTPYHMVFADPVNDLTLLSKEASAYSFLSTDGDGVVPVASGEADGFPTSGGGTRSLYRAPGVGHLALASDQRVIDLVMCLLARTPQEPACAY